MELYAKLTAFKMLFSETFLLLSLTYLTVGFTFTLNQTVIISHIYFNNKFNFAQLMTTLFCIPLYSLYIALLYSKEKPTDFLDTCGILKRWDGKRWKTGKLKTLRKDEFFFKRNKDVFPSKLRNVAQKTLMINNNDYDNSTWQGRRQNSLEQMS